MPPISIVTANAAEGLERDAWERLCPPGDPFLNGDFLSILERHETAGPACGWQAHHQVATSTDGTVVGLLPSYVKTNSHGDFVRDWSWAAAYDQLGKSYYPKLLSGIPHTPASGPRFLVAPDTDCDQIKTQLIQHTKALVAEHGFSSWHVALPAPEEVEAALKSHPAVYDCLVVGVPDQRWGQRVAAIVAIRDDHSTTLEDLTDHARTLVAGYKVPRELHVVEQIVRSPSGKPDYPWAKQIAEAGTARVD